MEEKEVQPNPIIQSSTNELSPNKIAERNQRGKFLNKRVRRIVVLFLIGTAILVITYYSGKQQGVHEYLNLISNLPTPTKTTYSISPPILPNPTGPEKILTLKRLTLQLPAQWHSQKDYSMRLWLSPKPFGEGYLFEISVDTENRTLEEKMQELIKAEYLEDIVEEKITISGFEGKILEGKCSPSNDDSSSCKGIRFNLPGKIAFFKVENDIYTFIGDISTDEYRKSFDQILSTFKFLDNENVVCTQEVKVCLDGDSVGRQGPNCEFAPCPRGE